MKAFIGLGSNLGNTGTILQKAWKVLGDTAGIVVDGLSSPYMTAPVGMISNHWFINAVGRLEVSLSPLALLKILLDVEVSLGRVRDEDSLGYQDRSLDLDLLYYGNLVMDEPGLILPHPRIDDRLFVLVPLVELEPDLRDSGTGESLASIKDRLREEIGTTVSKEQEIIRSTWEALPAHLQGNKIKP